MTRGRDFKCEFSRDYYEVMCEIIAMGIPLNE